MRLVGNMPLLLVTAVASSLLAVGAGALAVEDAASFVVFDSAGTELVLIAAAVAASALGIAFASARPSLLLVASAAGVAVLVLGWREAASLSICGPDSLGCLAWPELHPSPDALWLASIAGLVTALSSGLGFFVLRVNGESLSEVLARPKTGRRAFPLPEER
jgi:hypothetical protein